MDRSEMNEFRNFGIVLLSAVISLSYCHTIGKIVPKGLTRLSTILPVVFFFYFLPLNLSTIYLGGPVCFFLAWLANFKLLLFAFGQGPLSKSSSTSVSTPLSLPYFISIACLPIKIIKDHPNHDQNHKSLSKPKPYKTLNITSFAIKVALLVTFGPVHARKDYIHPKIIMLLYCVHLYLALEFLLALFAGLARAYLGLEFEPQFNEPYLATSLQDFWGRRWNLMVPAILRPTIYNPIKFISSRLIGKTWAPLPGVLATFIVSGMMHELIFYYIGRKKPTWRLTWFFLIHGTFVVIEILVKKLVFSQGGPKWQLPRMVSGPLTLVFVTVTSLWMFMPELMYSDMDVMIYRESMAIINFIRGVAMSFWYGLLNSIGG